MNKLKDEAIPENESEQQMRERLRRKARRMMFNENGVAYAPWIANQVDEDAIVGKHGKQTKHKFSLVSIDNQLNKLR